MLDQETGEFIERRLEHESGEARAFYAALSGPVRVGIEATGHTRWIERMLAQIRASVVRKQKTDARDASHLLDLQLPVERFEHSKQVVSYLGLNPHEHSSGGRQRLGAISKQRPHPVFQFQHQGPLRTHQRAGQVVVTGAVSIKTLLEK